ncbi:ribonuclease H-like domain-containing protein [Dactylonectria estremocensis]|uniref:Ribonuclease H-like domain-containing protein n=1 Tax=Dactylonectria estremocensis TaxID=1079267 RepID=A0A9P9F0K9_9HYPO|nr:ribonuclease H-like domain-containing protein [Dactylonectria estremocensis]
MSSPSHNQLWNPNCGIRFSPRNNAPPLYPLLDAPRFLHATLFNASKSSNAAQPVAQPAAVAPENFDLDEQFELDAAEWFDQQDAMSTPVGAGQHVQDPKKPQEPQQAAEGTSDPPPGTNDTAKVEQEVLPPLTSLEYNIDKGLFQAARNTKEGAPGSFWSHTMYHHIQSDGSARKVKVHYCTSKHTMEYICEKYFLNEKVLGFDLEWMAYVKASAGPRQNVSLIQIASPSRIALFHVARFIKDDFIGPKFRQIMEDESVSKTGVNIRGDCTRLKTYFGIETKGIFELSHLYKLVKHTKENNLNLINKRVVAMAVQVKDYLRLPLYKGESVRTSNWMVALDEKQISYSASDAYAGIQLYYVLDEERQKLDPCPPRPEFIEKRVPAKVVETANVDEDADIDPPDDEAKDAPEPVAEAAKPPGAVSVPKPKQPVKERDCRIIAAEVQLQLYRSQKGNHLSVSPSALRAYYIWNTNNDLSPDSVAKLLREPPLKTNTVVTYILDSITLEKLPFSKERLRGEILSFLSPNKFVQRKYKALMQEAQAAEETRE